jgi:hypothetical protein
MAMEPVFERAELPPAGQGHVWYIPNTQSCGQDGLLLKIATSTGRKWLCMVADDGAYKGPFLMPDKHSIYANGIIIDRDHPDRWRFPGVDPVQNTVWGPEEEIVVLVGYKAAEAYSAKGKLWVRDLAVDDLRIDVANDNTLKCSGFMTRAKLIDLKTGHTKKQVEV